MTASSSWMRYRGDGTTPSGERGDTRGEPGRYLADPRLATAVNTALAVEQPLLVTGEAGTGKTMLAWSISAELGLGDVLAFHTRSDNQARDTLYEIDHLLRFYHAQTRDPRAENIETYVKWQALGEAIRSAQQRVVLIGNARVWRDADVVTGERITIYIAEDRSVVEGGKQERVKAIFYQSGPNRPKSEIKFGPSGPICP